jgi:hypothetical protein
MGDNVARGYRDGGGTRMWGAYVGSTAGFVEHWTNTTSAAWQKFDAQATMYGEPTAVWVQVCVTASHGATTQEVNQLIANAREHAAPGATIYVTGQTQYQRSGSCSVSGATGPGLTDTLAREAGMNATLNVIYSGVFGPLLEQEVSDGCFATSEGQARLGQQARGFWN